MSTDAPQAETQQFTVKQLAGSWLVGFNAYHKDVPYEPVPDGPEALQAEWRKGWLNAKQEDGKATS